MAGITQDKQKALFSLRPLNKNSRNVEVSRGLNSTNNNIDDNNKTNNNNKILIIAITVVIIITLLLLIISINNNINNNVNVSKNQVTGLKKCFLRLCLKVFNLSVFFIVFGI